MKVSAWKAAIENNSHTLDISNTIAAHQPLAYRNTAYQSPSVTHRAHITADNRPHTTKRKGKKID